MDDQRLEPLAERIAHATRLTILTGAGVSAASGVPMFRGASQTPATTRGGAAPLWERFRPEELATPEAFARDPRLVWEWYAWRRATVAACVPNPAHDVIAAWSQRDGCCVITQNVDDLHVRAGTRDLVRLHGLLWELRCWADCREGRVAWRDERVSLDPLPPRCPSCGALARPAIVWFGEGLAPADIDRAIAACACDVFVTVGTSAVVYPAAGLVERARRLGAFTAEVNLEATPASAAVDVAIHGPAEVVLPHLVRRRDSIS